MYIDRVAFSKNRIMSQLLFQDRHGARQGVKCCLMGLDLDVGTFLQVHASQQDRRALSDAQVVHHPDWCVAHALLGRELEHAAVRPERQLGVLVVGDHECHGVLDAHLGKLLQGARRQDDFVSPIKFGLADKFRTVDGKHVHVHGFWIGIVTDIHGEGLPAATIMAFILVLHFRLIR